MKTLDDIEPNLFNLLCLPSAFVDISAQAGQSLENFQAWQASIGAEIQNAGQTQS
jgi:hypothetical protein